MKPGPIQAPAPAPGTDASMLEWVKDAMDLKAALDEHAIVSITDPDGRISFVSDKFCATTGYTRSELLGVDHRVLNSGHHPKQFFRDLWRSIKSGLVWHGDIRNRAKDGSFYWVASTIVPFLDANEQPRQFVAISADITEQKRTREQLERKLRVQALLTDLTARFVGIGAGHIDEAIRAIQHQMAETLGWDRSTLWQESDGHPGMALTHVWQAPGWPVLPSRYEMEPNLPWAYARIRAGEGFRFYSTRELPPEAARDVEVFREFGSRSNVTIPLLSNGRVFGALSVATLSHERRCTDDELTELKLVAQIVGNALGRQRAEDRADELRRELAHTMRVASLGGLAEGLAHELNQPLAAILSNAQAARRFIANGGIDPEELCGILDDIVRADKRAGGVIHNLRAMVSKNPVARELCCLNDLVGEVMELMHAEFIGEHIQVRTLLELGLPPVEIARVELQQVLVNLMVNAVQAMQHSSAEDRLLEVETCMQGRSAVVSVRDRGHGIPASRLGTIFEPFFSTKTDGLGMGLSICRTIIDNHAGKIEAANGSKGAVFTFSLPLPASSLKTAALPRTGDACCV
jgi:PAS domain S-box-containing protein